MKRAIIQGWKVGAAVGFVATAIYSLSIILVKLILNSTPFTQPDLKDFGFILVILTIILIASSLIGSATGIFYSLIIWKFQPKQKTFVAICISFCILVISPVYASVFNTFRNVTYWDAHVVNSFTILILIWVMPSIIYVVAGGFTGRYLYQHSQ